MTAYTVIIKMNNTVIITIYNADFLIDATIDLRPSS